jgi:hypothetical protein
MDIDDFLKLVKKGSIKNIEIFKVPKQDKGDDIPHIKNNITQENYMHQVDLLYLPTSSFGYKYALVCVDVSNSKMDAIPLKTKAPTSIKSALQKIYDKRKILKYPLLLQFDSGTEFKNSVIKQFLKNTKVAFRFTTTNRHRQNSLVEAKNKYLGSLIMKFLTLREMKTGKPSKVWHPHLDKFINFINSKVKTYKPLDMMEDVVGTNFALDGLGLGEKVRIILNYPIDAATGKRMGSIFRAGDVRYSNDIYIIKHIILNPNMPPMYMVNVKNYKNKIDTSVAYTKNQLLRVK